MSTTRLFGAPMLRRRRAVGVDTGERTDVGWRYAAKVAGRALGMLDRAGVAAAAALAV